MRPGIPADRLPSYSADRDRPIVIGTAGDVPSLGLGYVSVT